MSAADDAIRAAVLLLATFPRCTVQVFRDGESYRACLAHPDGKSTLYGSPCRKTVPEAIVAVHEAALQDAAEEIKTPQARLAKLRGVT